MWPKDLEVRKKQSNTPLPLKHSPEECVVSKTSILCTSWAVSCSGLEGLLFSLSKILFAFLSWGRKKEMIGQGKLFAATLEE